MRVEHLDHLNLSVESLAETAAWYGRVFGFELVERGVRLGRPWGVLRSGEALLCAHERPGRRIADMDDLDASGRHGIRHFGLRIRDRPAWEATIEREALELGWNSPVRYPHSTSWYVRDPSGYEVEVALWDGAEVAFG
jgi:lactoylglutathione lyase